MQQHIDSFQNWCEKSTSENTAENYATVVQGFYKRIEEDQEISLTEEDQYYERISNAIANKITSNSMKFGLKKYLDWRALKSLSVQAERTAEFLKRKIDRVEIVTDSKDIESKVIAPQLVVKIVDEANEIDEEFGLMLRMMYETGSRFSGMNQLLWKDVFREQWRGETLDDTQVFISKTRSKGKVDGTTRISTATLDQVKQMYQERQADSDDLVFLPEMQRRSVYQKAWRLFDQYPEDTTTHSFRHSRLTHLGLKMYEENGLDYPVVKERLKNYARHAQGETTEDYIDLVKKKIQQKNQDLSKYTTVDWS